MQFYRGGAIYSSTTKREQRMIEMWDALKVYEDNGTYTFDGYAVRLQQEYDFDILAIGGMAKDRGMDCIKEFAARASVLDSLDWDSPQWDRLYSELEEEVKPYAPRDINGMVYHAHCTNCAARVIAETDQDLSGRVMGFSCDGCGTAFYTRVPGKAARLRGKTDQIQEVILQTLTGDELPMTIRHVFYTLAGYGYVKKDDKGYDATVYQLGIMREAGQVPYSWLADNTRWHISAKTHSSAEAALQNTVETYRRALWETQPVYVEIWTEKDAIASILASVTRPYDVPLFVARGYSSKTAIYNIAESIKEIGKPAYIYHFGDYDFDGVQAFEKAAAKLKQFGARYGAVIHIERVAVTEAQIREWNLPTRQTKKSRLKQWGNKPNVELDVMPSSRLRELARACIEQHIDRQELARIQRIEQQERAALQTVLSNFRLAQNSEEV